MTSTLAAALASFIIRAVMLRVVFVAGVAGWLLCEAQVAAPEKFEVASVKIDQYSRASCLEDSRGCGTMGAWGGSAFTVNNMSLEFLVELAYGVESLEISGKEHLPSDRYDVSAKPISGLVTYERARPMLRTLLEERFGLKTHRENREVSGYALVVAKAGPKLKAAGDASRPLITWPGGLEGGPANIDALAYLLSNLVKQPVANKTNIAGNYDLRLRFAPDGDTKSTLPSLFTAIQEQFGLRLESQKVPVEFLVIDQCNKTPTEN